MTSQAYYDWRAKGSPFTLAQPCADLQKLLQGAGFTVFAYPDDAHLNADPPEDHTPFSATGWPIASPFGYGHAIDIMPSAGKMPLSQLADRIIAAKRRGAPGAAWIKYLNWTDAAGVTRHISWQPTEAIRTSTDKGHIHISSRSDYTKSNVVSMSGWNPLADNTSTGGTGGMSFTDADEAFLKGAPWQYNGRGIGENSDTVKRSMLSYQNEILKLVRSTSSNVDDLASGTVIAQAFIAALAGNPAIVDALATAVAARIGMIPSAREIAKAVGELVWHGSAGS